MTIKLIEPRPGNFVLDPDIDYVIFMENGQSVAKILPTSHLETLATTKLMAASKKLLQACRIALSYIDSGSGRLVPQSTGNTRNIISTAIEAAEFWSIEEEE